MDISSEGPSDPQHQLINSPPVKSRRKRDALSDDGRKRRCISSACVPCRKRKSKCDGTTPACSACVAVYNTKSECIYDPNSDHRRKGVYKKDIDNLKTRNSTLQTLIQAILNYPEDDVAGLVRQIRTCESLDAVAEAILAKENGEDDEDEQISPMTTPTIATKPTFENQLSGKMGELRLEDGSTRHIGGTSHLIYLEAGHGTSEESPFVHDGIMQQEKDPLTSWTDVTSDLQLVRHLIDMYFCWHYTFFTTMSKHTFLKEFKQGKPAPGSRRKTEFCTPLLVNAMLALGCHFTAVPGARADPEDSATAGDHFFKEAKRLIMEEDLHEVAALTTVQALALMSVREAGCGREAKGWVYSGMSFRMACDLGLQLGMTNKSVDEEEEDVRRITFWGCFLFDKCWSNYLGRMPQLPNAILTVPKFDIFPAEDAETWSAYTDSGISQAHSQPSRTRAVALQISSLSEINSDLMNAFYNPIDIDKAKGKHSELKKLSELHQRLETWKRELPKELEPKEGGLPAMLVMHMFFQLLYIHLFRPFLKYNPDNSPLPTNVSPRKICTQAAAMISKLLRLYKRSHGLRQICNIVVYIAHSACTIHLLNLPEKNAKRDITHGVKHLEEIAESWLCARRTLNILSALSHRWKVELPEEAAMVLARTDSKFGPWNDVVTPRSIKRDSVSTIEDNYYSQHASPAQQAYPPGLTGAPQSVHHTNGAYAVASHNQQPLEARYLPPNELDASAYSDVQHQHQPSYDTPPANYSSNSAVTPLSNQTRGSIDPPPTTASEGASPSQLFGGVEQLIREGQDWWVRDQNQLAVGFDNWTYNTDDIAGWFAGQQANGAGPTRTLIGAPNGRGAVVAPAVRQGSQVNAVAAAAAVNGMDREHDGIAGLGAGTYTAHLHGYDESEWYQ